MTALTRAARHARPTDRCRAGRRLLSWPHAWPQAARAEELDAWSRRERGHTDWPGSAPRARRGGRGISGPPTRARSCRRTGDAAGLPSASRRPAPGDCLASGECRGRGLAHRSRSSCRGGAGPPAAAAPVSAPMSGTAGRARPASIAAKALPAKHRGAGGGGRGAASVTARRTRGPRGARPRCGTRPGGPRRRQRSATRGGARRSPPCSKDPTYVELTARAGSLPPRVAGPPADQEERSPRTARRPCAAQLAVLRPSGRCPAALAPLSARAAEQAAGRPAAGLGAEPVPDDACRHRAGRPAGEVARRQQRLLR